MPAADTRSVSRLVARQAKGYMSEEKFRQGQGPLLPRNAVGDAALAPKLVQVGDVPVVVSHQGLLVPSLPLENLKIAFPSKPACVFRLRAS